MPKCCHASNITPPSEKVLFTTLLPLCNAASNCLPSLSDPQVGQFIQKKSLNSLNVLNSLNILNSLNLLQLSEVLSTFQCSLLLVMIGAEGGV